MQALYACFAPLAFSCFQILREVFHLGEAEFRSIWIARIGRSPGRITSPVPTGSTQLNVRNLRAQFFLGAFYDKGCLPPRRLISASIRALPRPLTPAKDSQKLIAQSYPSADMGHHSHSYDKSLESPTRTFLGSSKVVSSSASIKRAKALRWPVSIAFII